MKTCDMQIEFTEPEPKFLFVGGYYDGCRLTLSKEEIGSCVQFPVSISEN